MGQVQTVLKLSFQQIFSFLEVLEVFATTEQPAMQDSIASKAKSIKLFAYEHLASPPF